MHRNQRWSAALVALILGGCFANAAPRPTPLDGAAAQPPVAKKEPHETQFLKLNCEKAWARLGWKPHWNIEDALAITTEWYLAHLDGMDMRETTIRQIRAYEATGAGVTV